MGKHDYIVLLGPRGVIDTRERYPQYKAFCKKHVNAEQHAMLASVVETYIFICTFNLLKMCMLVLGRKTCSCLHD